MLVKGLNINSDLWLLYIVDTPSLKEGVFKSNK